MNTNQFARQLASDLAATPSSRAIGPRLMLVTLLASAVSLAAILLLFSRSPHLTHGPTPTILVTALAGMALAVGAFWAALRTSYPESRVSYFWLGMPVAILVAGLGMELSHVSQSTWTERLWGGNPLACYLAVTALSLPILAAVLVALREGASTRPRFSGAMAGLLAGGIVAALYTIHCPENSLLFIASWHVLAILSVSLIGAVAAGRLLRW
jgi:hypothetical protein